MKYSPHQAAATRVAGIVVVCLNLLCLGGHAVAQSDPGNAVPAEQKKRLVEQKLRLVEQLLKSPAAKSAAYGRDADSPVLVERGTQLVEQAKAALAAGDLDLAATALDEALRSASKASKRLAPDAGSLNESAQRASARDLAEQVATYRAAIADLLKDGQLAAAAGAVLQQIDAQVAAAQRSAAEGRLGESNKTLGDTYRLAVQELSRLRAGQTVVMSLKFDTLADEYAYEQRRHRSQGMLLEMMLGEGRAEGAKRSLVDRFVAAAREHSDLAERQAGAGDYKSAVASMERANGEIVRALQTVGVPVF